MLYEIDQSSSTTTFINNNSDPLRINTIIINIRFTIIFYLTHSRTHTISDPAFRSNPMLIQPSHASFGKNCSTKILTFFTGMLSGCA